VVNRRGKMSLWFQRADTLRRHDIEERLVQVEAADGVPFGFGRFRIEEHPWGEGGSGR